MGLLTVNRKYTEAALVNLRSRWMYPGDFFGGLISYGLFVFIFAQIWAAAFAGKFEIAGYDRLGATWYFIAAELCLFAGGGLFWSLSNDVKSGQVATVMGRPFGFLTYQFTQSLGVYLTEGVILGLSGVGIGLLTVGPWQLSSVVQVLALILSFLLSFSIQFFLQACLSLTAFWFEENSAFFWIYQKLALVVGTLVPLEFLPQAAQALALWTPFPYITWVPARLLVHWDPSQVLWMLGVQGLWALAAALGAKGIFEMARRRLTIQGG